MFKRFVYSVILMLLASMGVGYAQTLTMCEHWMDDDYTSRKTISNPSSDLSLNIDVSKVDAGVHFWNFRARNSLGEYSSVSRYLVYIPTIAPADAKLTSYEYWMDDDYKDKVTTKFTEGQDKLSISYDVSKLDAGVHFFNFRAKNTNNDYGAVSRYLVYIPTISPADATLSSYEYWMDDDYEARVCANSTQSSYNFMVDVSKYGEGIHYFNFRAKNSTGEYSALNRYLFYMSDATENGNSPIVGYQYSFNNSSKYVSIDETDSYSMNSLAFPLPDIKDVATINSNTPFLFSNIGDTVSLNQSTAIDFCLKFKNKANQWSTPVIYSYTEKDSIKHIATALGVQKSLKFSKVKQGDFIAVKIILPETRNYYFRSSQSCQMELYGSNGDKITSVSSDEMLKTYSSGLVAGTYYGVIYNTLTDKDNTDSDISIRLMLTNNITPTPEIAYADETVTITCAQEGAQTYYTLDGTDPTTESTKYTAPFKLDHNATIKALATYSDLADSYIASYTIDSYVTKAPVIQFANLKVYMSTETPEAKIYYTTDGSEPTTASTLYLEPVTITQNCTVKAIAKREGYNASTATSFDLDVDNVTCVSPVITVSGTQMTMASLTEGVTIYYTKDGSTPTKSSTKYNGAINLSRNNVYKAFAVKSGLLDSPVATYTVDWFQAETPQFSYANNLLTITCSTPGAVIRYEVGGGAPTGTSTVYSAPIQLTDNSIVKAYATADGFNDSEVASFTPNNFTCEEVTFSYDGRSIEMNTATSGATIYYTTNGNSPTLNSTVYSGKVLLSGNSTIKAMAVKDEMNNSNVTEFETPAYYNNGVASVNKEGCLSKAFEWCGGSSKIENITVNGNADATDVAYIKSMTALKTLNISSLKVKDNTLADKALSNMKNLLYASLPQSLTSCGSGLLDGCSSLAAVKWNAEMDVTTQILGNVTNPNLLLYVTRKSYAPSTIKNVIANGVADAIVLQDIEGNGNFYCPERFLATSIKYTHNYSQKTETGICRGWETLSLPFDVQTITHATNGDMAPFAKAKSGAKPFWLYKLSSSGFEHAADIEAYTPYIISMPNNSEYIDDYVLAGDVTFSASNTYVEADTKKTTEGSSFDFVPNYLNIEKTDSIYVINVGQEYNGYVEGSLFVRNFHNVKPFEAYMRANDISMARNYFSIFDEANSISEVIPTKNYMVVYSQGSAIIIVSPKAQTVDIINSAGAKARTVKVTPGENRFEGFPVGIYVINKKKIVTQ